MSKTTYNLQLKGYVGGYYFDRATVDKELAKNDGKQVNVLIDSLGGSLATGSSIFAAFKNHGNVAFRGSQCIFRHYISSFLFSSERTS